MDECSQLAATEEEDMRRKKGRLELELEMASGQFGRIPAGKFIEAAGCIRITVTAARAIVLSRIQAPLLPKVACST
jgi:hypothetical protein